MMACFGNVSDAAQFGGALPCAIHFATPTEWTVLAVALIAVAGTVVLARCGEFDIRDI